MGKEYASLSDAMESDAARRAARDLKLFDRYGAGKPLGHDPYERLLIERDKEVAEGWAVKGSPVPIGQRRPERAYADDRLTRPSNAEVQLMDYSADALGLPA